MSRISAVATVRLFARVALTRMLNRSSLLNLYSRLRKPATESDVAAGASIRTATQHRDTRGSLRARLAGPMLLGMMTMGWVIFCASSVQSLFDFARLSDIAADAATDRPIVVAQSDYDALGVAIADGRQEEIQRAVNSAFGSIPPWLTAETERVVLERVASRGTAAFVVAADSTTWRGTAALLSASARRGAFASVGLYLLLASGAAVAMGVGLSSKSLTQAEPGLTWLLQFPLSRTVLFAAKVVENALDGPTAVIAASLAVPLAYQCGFTFLGGAAFAAISGVAMAATVGALRVAIELGLLQLCSRKVRGMFVATLSMMGGICLFYIMFMSNSRLTLEVVPFVAHRLPSFVYWNPFSQGFGAAMQLEGLASAWWLAGPIGAMLSSAAAVAFAVRLTRHGLASGQDAVRTDRTVAAQATLGPATQFRPGFFSGMARKELLQLRRQPERIGQVLLAPLFIVFLIFLNGPDSKLAHAVRGGAAICSAIFVGATYLLLVAVNQMLTGELKTLWFLQCLPKSLAATIRIKARFWGAAAIGMTVVAMVMAFGLLPDDRSAIAARLPFMVVGTWLMAEIVFGVMSLGATIVNDQTIRIRRSTLLVPSILMATSASAVYTGDVWSQVVLVVVMGMLNVAVRQKQEAELGWLSEPAENPPRRLYAMHGLIAIVGFLFFRDFLKPLLFAAQLADAEILALAYCGSAAAVGLLSWIWIKRSGFYVLPPTASLSNSAMKSIALGLGVTCLVGLCWDGFLRIAVKSHGAVVLNPTWHADADGNYLGNWMLIFMVVIAAPVFEEWIFRGLLYRSLRQSLGAVASIVGTSLLFTVVHPLSSSVAVLVLGVAAAWIVERTGRLWPSMVVHVGYNLFVVVLWNLRM